LYRCPKAKDLIALISKVESLESRLVVGRAVQVVSNRCRRLPSKKSSYHNGVRSRLLTLS
jgi:hypothetical protein